MTLLRDLINIPETVSEGDFVVNVAAGADLDNYVVTDQLQEAFGDALKRVGHALSTGTSQAVFLHGSFGSGKSHFMAVLREILRRNNEARKVRGLTEVITAADPWLKGSNLLTLTYHMLDARSIEQAVLEGYLNYVARHHPNATPPPVHRSDKLLESAANLRARIGDTAFFAELAGGGAAAEGGGNLAQREARRKGWTADSYARAAAAKPGTPERDALVSALTTCFFGEAVRVGDYVDLDTGLQIITRHAKDLGYTGIVLFLDELILWLSTKITDSVFVNTEVAKLNKFVESADESRPLPIVAFVARQRPLEDFLGPQAGGTERAMLETTAISNLGRLGQILLPDTNLPEIVGKRLLRPKDGSAKRLIDAAVAQLRANREVWDTLLVGTQYADAGVGSDAVAFRQLYPFSPALVAALVALSQALQRQRTAIRIMSELLCERRDTLRVNDIIGVAALFEPLVLRGELPDQPKLKLKFQAARDIYRNKLRPLLLARNAITEEQAATHEQFKQDDNLIRTLLLAALIPDAVPALSNLTAARLHALNFGNITAPIAGFESQIIVDRLTRIAHDAGALRYTEGPDPVFSIELSTFDPERWLDLVPHNETTAGVLQQIVRDMICEELGLGSGASTYGDLDYVREWRGRRHNMVVRFGNIRDRNSMPDADCYPTGDDWRIVIDYPFDVAGQNRLSDKARIEQLDRGHKTVFWIPYFLSSEAMGRVAQLAKINYLLTGDRINTIAADYSAADRQQGKLYFQQRQQQLRSALLDALKQAYGVTRAQPSEVEIDPAVPVLMGLAEAMPLGDPRGGTLKAAFANLTGDLLKWTYPGTPAFADDEKVVSRSEMAKVLRYARQAAADPTRATVVETADRRSVARIVNSLRLGEVLENRYAIAVGNYWSSKLPQELRVRGYVDNIPVPVIRELLDHPQRRGYEREMQNLVIAVFALEQQLAWYDRGGKVDITSVQQINDHMELRKPPMPDEHAWAAAVRRAKSLFGLTVPEYFMPEAVTEFAKAVRAQARQHLTAAQEMVQLLLQRAEPLGIDVDARSGRLATARRVARLLGKIAGETDDVVLVTEVSDADVGDIDDAAAAIAFKQAEAVNAALAEVQWELLDAVRTRAAADAKAMVIIEELELAAQENQHVQQLQDVLRATVRRAAAYLAEVPAPAPAPPYPAGGGGWGGTAATVDDTGAVPPDLAAPPVESVEVSDEASLDRAVARVRSQVAAGQRVRLSWQVLP